MAGVENKHENQSIQLKTYHLIFKTFEKRKPDNGEEKILKEIIREISPHYSAGASGLESPSQWVGAGLHRYPSLNISERERAGHALRVRNLSGSSQAAREAAPGHSERRMLSAEGPMPIQVSHVKTE